MTTRKLMTSLKQKTRKDLGKKLKLSYEESKLDSLALENLKLVFGTSSTQRIIENAFNILALSELTKQESIYDFPAYDYMQKLISLGENSEELNSIYIPRWIIAATSSFVKNKYNKL